MTFCRNKIWSYISSKLKMEKFEDGVGQAQQQSLTYQTALRNTVGVTYLTEKLGRGRGYERERERERERESVRVQVLDFQRILRRLEKCTLH